MNQEPICLKKKSNIFNIAGKLSLNEWRGQKNVEFIIDDISVNKNHKNKVPSSIGQDSWFSSNKEGFDSPWDRQEIKLCTTTLDNLQMVNGRDL